MQKYKSFIYIAILHVFVKKEIKKQGNNFLYIIKETPK